VSQLVRRMVCRATRVLLGVPLQVLRPARSDPDVKRDSEGVDSDGQERYPADDRGDRVFLRRLVQERGRSRVPIRAESNEGAGEQHESRRHYERPTPVQAEPG
jgi:hypothetical protein